LFIIEFIHSFRGLSSLCITDIWASASTRNLCILNETCVNMQGLLSSDQFVNHPDKLHMSLCYWLSLIRCLKLDHHLLVSYYLVSSLRIWKMGLRLWCFLFLLEIAMVIHLRQLEALLHHTHRHNHTDFVDLDLEVVHCTGNTVVGQYYSWSIGSSATEDHASDYWVVCSSCHWSLSIFRGSESVYYLACFEHHSLFPKDWRNYLVGQVILMDHPYCLVFAILVHELLLVVAVVAIACLACCPFLECHS